MSADRPARGRFWRTSRPTWGAGLGCGAIVVILLTSPLAAASENGRPPEIHAGKNIEISASVHPDWSVREPFIAVDPRNPEILAAAAFDNSLVPSGGHIWDRYFRSTDGGKSWSSMRIPGFPGDDSKRGQQSPLLGQNGSADPMVAFDDHGNLYYSGLAEAIPPGETIGSTPLTVFVTKFADDGAHYVRTTLASNPSFGSADFPRLAVDATGGPHDGNVYVAYDNESTPNDIKSFTRSIDGGRTFSAPILVNGSFLTPTVDPQGNVLVEGCNPCYGEGVVDHQLVSESTNGGQSFHSAVVVGTSQLDLAPYPSFAPNWFAGADAEIAADSHGIYVTYPGYDVNRGVYILNFTRSVDGGHTWSAPVRLGEARNANQFEGSLAVANGVIHVAWYDSRNGQQPNGNVTKLDVYYAASFDHGRTFSHDIRVSTHSWNPSIVYVDDPASDFPLQSAWFGEYFGLAASLGSAHVLWVSNRNACDVTNATYGCVDQDLLTATITFGDGCGDSLFSECQRGW